MLHPWMKAPQVARGIRGIRGQYRGELSRNGKVKRIWLGKQYTVAYLNRPWEKEAFRRESELAIALLDSIAQKAKKNKRVG